MIDMTDDQEIPGQESILDTDAPYGRKADGSPKAKPGRRPSASAGAVPPPKRSTAAPKARAASKPKQQISGTDYRPGLGGLIQLGLAPLVLAAKTTDSPALMADAATVAMHAPALVEAVNDLAQEMPQVANVLDRVLQVGPYGALLTAVTAIGFQIAANHGVMPAGMLGTREPAVLATEFAQQVSAAHAEQVAAMAAAA